MYLWTSHFSRKLILISLGSLLLIVNLANGQQPKETKRVLILITGQKNVPGYVLAEEAMRASLDQSMDFQIEYFIEHMDRYRFKDASYQKILLDLYRTKYVDKKIDLIIAYGYHALEFTAAHGDDIFPHTPVVFSAVFIRTSFPTCVSIKSKMINDCQPIHYDSYSIVDLFPPDEEQSPTSSCLCWCVYADDHFSPGTLKSKFKRIFEPRYAHSGCPADGRSRNVPHGRHYPDYRQA